MKGIDCVTGLTAGSARRVKEAGFDFVGRYLVPPGMHKELTRAEAEAICAAGLGILTVWETYANRAGEGEAAGAVDGAKALQCAREIDMPESGMIYFAVDYDAGAGDFDRIAAYLRGARSQTGPYNIGVYGSARVMDAVAERLGDADGGICRGFWQCVAWSGGRVSDHTQVYQYEWSGGPEALAARATLGFPVDINRCGDLSAAGIWNYEEDNMTGQDIIERITGEQAYQLLQKAQDYAAARPLPDWLRPDSPDAKTYAAAKARGVTDGTRPMALVTRLEAALMAARGK